MDLGRGLSEGSRAGSRIAAKGPGREPDASNGENRARARSLTLAVLTWGLLALAGIVAGFLLADPAGPQRLAVLAVTVLTVALLAATAGCLATGTRFASTPAGAWLLRRAAALRKKSWRVAFLRLRDPGAPGRTRPRAPTAAPAAA